MGINSMLEADAVAHGHAFQGFNRQIPRTEHSVMDNIRNNMSNEHWAEFLKCFSLYFETTICY